MFIYILATVPDPGLATSWSVHCLLYYCPGTLPLSCPALLCPFHYCCGALEVLTTSDVVSGGSEQLLECDLFVVFPGQPHTLCYNNHLNHTWNPLKFILKLTWIDWKSLFSRTSYAIGTRNLLLEFACGLVYWVLYPTFRPLEQAIASGWTFWKKRWPTCLLSACRTWKSE